MTKMPLTQEDKEILLSQSGSKTSAQWVEYFNGKYTKKQIYNFCYNNCTLPKKTKQPQAKSTRQYHINQDYFKTWSAEMAYTLGLWYAVGHIYNGRFFDISLHKKDKYVLKKIAQELQYGGQLYDGVDRQAARINFSCKVIYDDLIALTNGSKLPHIPSEYRADFVRGYFDGNGTVTRIKGNRLNLTLEGRPKAFLRSLLQLLKEEAGVTGGSFDDSCMSLKFGKHDTIKLGKYMYQNNSELYLKRKKDKFPLD